MFGNVSSNARHEVNATLIVLQPLQRIEVVFMVNYQTADATSYENLVNKTMDLCTFLRYPLLDPLAKLFFDAVKSKPKNRMFESCPIVKVRKKFFLFHFFQRNYK